ncbi:Phosphoserine phosphatase [Gracilaria domingensis]|nr:Phosphoserine phosphatase [Gracilaria domingensis]
MAPLVDDLEAAKAAALRDLLSGAGAHVLQTADTEPSANNVQKKTRRRRRPKLNALHAQVQPLEEHQDDSDDAVEYVPEQIADQSGSADNIDDVIGSMRRFVQRGVAEEPAQPIPSNDDHANASNSKQQAVEANGKADTAETAQAQQTDEKRAQRDEDATQPQALSRKKQKELRRYQISVLKSVTHRPEVVDSWDVTAPDPFLLVHLKTWPNSVQVPRNWRQKRKYLQNKRGMEKKAFQLPAYIADTGVGEMRSAQIEADQKKSLKQRQREKMRAKTGRGVEIDHSRLRDAFFKYQTKPRLSSHGDIYYELRELEVDGSRFRPGFLSEELRAALGVAEGDPPLWLVNMQRYGPPPGYPGLKIPGVNAPIPKGASYGYHMGGWGKPAVDEYGRPIYGDVFGEGLDFGRYDPRFDFDGHEKKKLWGELRKPGSKVTVAVGVGEESDSSEEGGEHGPEAEPSKEAAQAPAKDAQKSTSLQEEEHAKHGENVRKGIEPGRLYTVLEDRRVSVGQNSIMGSSHVYDIDKNGDERVPPGSSNEKVTDKRPRDRGEERRDGPIKRSKFKF